jgi:hypothetical protein
MTPLHVSVSHLSVILPISEDDRKMHGRKMGFIQKEIRFETWSARKTWVLRSRSPDVFRLLRPREPVAVRFVCGLPTRNSFASSSLPGKQRFALL